jgi:hypothetical protein
VEFNGATEPEIIKQKTAFQWRNPSETPYLSGFQRAPLDFFNGAPMAQTFCRHH